MNWTEEEVARLKELNAQKVPQSIIAIMLGKTRNAVGGMRGRMIAAGNLERTRRAPANPQKPRRKRQKTFKVKPGVYSVAPRPSPAGIIPRLVAFPDLEPHHCQSVIDGKYEGIWPIYCGNPKYNHAYCEGHAAKYGWYR